MIPWLLDQFHQEVAYIAANASITIILVEGKQLSIDPYAHLTMFSSWLYNGSGFREVTNYAFPPLDHSRRLSWKVGCISSCM